MDANAMFKLGYGLYVLTAREGQRDNGCIVNTLMQITSTPNRVLLGVNKSNFTHDMIAHSGQFNVSVLTEEVPFALFQRFGYQSGRETDKFAGFPHTARTENGLLYVTEAVNARLSARVVTATDMGSHTLFLADVTDTAVLGEAPSVTYAYYQSHIKPRPAPAAKRGWRCRICGYVYEGETLPPDFVCPICKHGAQDFERI